MDMDVVYQKLLNRLPTPRERTQIALLQEALNIRDNDALLSVLIGLQYHLELYRDMPRAIQAETLRISTVVLMEADTLVKSMTATFEKALAAATKVATHKPAPPTEQPITLAEFRPVVLGGVVGGLMAVMGLALGETLHLHHSPEWVHRWPAVSVLLNAPSGYILGSFAGLWLFTSLHPKAGLWVATVAAGVLMVGVGVLTVECMT